jgi:hypothetical protein
MTAQEWVDAAIACGANPVLIRLPDGRWGLQTSLVDIDHEKDPGPLPSELKPTVRELLQSVGRVWVQS